MSAYLETRLIELLPALYRELDETGDLETFLNIPAATLDELKALMDRFPEIFDVERGEQRWLPYLGEIVGHRFDPRGDATRQRRLIREAIEIYRRKGTLPAIGHALADLGWQGHIEETFRQALRLNRRAVVGRVKLPEPSTASASTASRATMSFRDSGTACGFIIPPARAPSSGSG